MADAGRRRYWRTIREHEIEYARRLPPLADRLTDYRAMSVDHLDVAARQVARATATLRRARLVLAAGSRP